MKLMVVLAFGLGSICAFATNLTPIEGANIKCSQDGAAVFVNLQQERLWQADSLEDKEGLELDIQDFAYMRCPGCYVVRGALSVMGQSMPLRYEFKAKGADYTKLSLRVTGGLPDDSFDIAQMDCSAKY